MRLGQTAKRTAAVAAAVVIVTGGGLTWATANDTQATTIHGCFNKNTGALRVVDEGASCRAGEQAISWNQTGPQGVAGPAGPQGPTGPEGAQGPPGPSGAATPASRWYADRDADGFGDWYDRIDSAAQPPGFVSNNDDCNDDADNIHPGGLDGGYGWDYDCDGVANDTAIRWYPDNDGDGKGVFTGSRSGFSGKPAGYSLHQHDCDDTDPSRKDSGCDDFDVWYGDSGTRHTTSPDDDGDGHDAAGAGGGDDCDDSNNLVFAGNAEVPYDGLDNDCDPFTLDVEARVDDVGRHDPQAWGWRSPS